MISAFTPPGTKIVALEDVEIRPFGKILVKNAVYTVAEMRSNPAFNEIDVVTEEIEHNRPFEDAFYGPCEGFWLRRYLFRYAALPRCLTELLERAPIDLVEA
jgi:hypothetical protein